MTPSEGFVSALAWFSVLCVALFWASPVRAQATDEAGARVLFTEGRKLADAGDYANACLKFEDSLRLDPGVGTNFNLADCLEHIGRTASAWGRFLDVAAATKAAGQPERERAARARAAALEPKLAQLVITVSAPVPGLVVERDGVPIGVASRGMAVPVDLGSHVLEATAPGRKKWTRSVTVLDGPSKLLVSVPELELLPPNPTVNRLVGGPVSHDLARRAPAADDSASTRRWSLPVLTLGALGTVAVASSVVLAFEMSSQNREAERLCLPNTCASVSEKSRHDSALTAAYRDRNLAIVGAGVGATALLAAAYLWWSPHHASKNSSALRAFGVRPSPWPLGAELGGAW